ncbi:precorrin-6y C5,15-methyltransferase (decarboxylating) subunit CbiE [Clostridium perfringens]|uniref:Precorrin-6Y-methylase n=1 Tax=Clostridium perfringens TaxID=1502 RepID=A0A127EIG2_CLOPF|nr:MULTISPECIES: precorrin-6y C5,15-methyltransferase (decarboxylating) subunit CbiE [Clostridium]AMN35712.1 precorrin-6Y-methylase [Clostridium perfringens]MDK7590122.1 precorrin-6y C5,15-methyltransferase (decarboxylating) subunit CbiE [Clostridium sp. UMB9555B]MDK7627484.1 precorrin-6y C5,15-methyltransferase (decarboxylating) subunit CbiE [Clostridium sp. UMB9555A]
MVKILGLGPGHEDYIIPKVIKELEKSDYIVGFERAISSLKFLNSINDERFKRVKGLKEIIEFLNENKEKRISIVASGDPTFYGITNYICKNYEGEVSIVPGISSFQYLTCRVNKTWNDAFVGSMHGREENFIEVVKENKLSIWLTDKKNTPSELSKRLIENSIECTIYVGENLSYENENITIGNPREICEKDYGDLSVIIIER